MGRMSNQPEATHFAYIPVDRPKINISEYGNETIGAFEMAYIFKRQPKYCDEPASATTFA